MIKIDIKSTECTEKSGTAKGTGKRYSFKEQQAWAHLPGEPYPSKIKLTLNDDEQPYPVGSYTLAPDSLYVGDFNALALKPRLIKA